MHFDLPQGVEGLEHPEPLDVETTFNEFVKEFGGQLIAEIVATDSRRPKNADYFFPKHSIIAELKCFKKDLFNNREDAERIARIMKKHSDSGTVTGSRGLGWIFRRAPIPPEYWRDMLSLARRSIENTIKKADKQIKSTKDMLGLSDVHSLVLLANDGNFFLDPANAVGLIAQVMEEHFMESNIDGFVYFTVNTVSIVPYSERDFIYWVPSYRKEGDEMADFVNKLGASWGEFYMKKIGQDCPNFQTEDYRILKSMRLKKTNHPFQKKS